MTVAWVILGCVAAVMAVPAAWLVRGMRRRHVHLWIGSYLKQSARRRMSRSGRSSPGGIDVLLCIADHFEPAWGGAGDATADTRVASWVRDYPMLLGSFRDSDGRPPRHTHFYPIDQYESRHVDALAALCTGGFGEVEIHLHHDRDTADNLERMLRRFTRLFSERHGLLGRWPDGSLAYGFVHGNWALDNSRPDGRWCGVANELDVLQRTGCYADFTMPSAPDATQTRTINGIYYATGSPHRCKSHDRGIEVGAGHQPPGSLMLIQGPLVLARPRGRWMPRIENGCLQGNQPPTMERLDHWVRAGVRIASRPGWVFVKLHTHGAVEANRGAVLGPGAVEFHRSLARRAAEDPRFRFHYVTAREMYNLAKAAEAGWQGPITSVLDSVVSRPRPHNAGDSGSPRSSAQTLSVVSQSDR